MENRRAADEPLHEVTALLARQLEVAREQQARMAALDGEGVMACVRAREELSRRTQARMKLLEPQADAGALSEARKLARQLVVLDQINREVAGRALAQVNGFLAALRPPSSAYDRAGRAAGAQSYGSTRSVRL